MSEVSPRPSPTLDVPRLDTSTSFRKEAYAALKRAITAMDIYDHTQEIRLPQRSRIGRHEDTGGPPCRWRRASC